MDKLVFLFFLLFCTSFTKGQNLPIHFVENPDSQKVSIYVKHALFTEYLYSDTLPKQILYPIYAASGTEITRAYPIRFKKDERTDHPHQVGLWFNFGDVNGLDYWNAPAHISQEQKDHYGIIRFDRIQSISEEEGKLEVTADWMTCYGHILLKEETSYVFTGSSHKRGILRTTVLIAIADSV